MFEEFRDSLQLDHVRIKRPNQVFLCGGEVKDEPTRPKTARGVFLDHLKANRTDLVPSVVLAEKVVGDQEAHGYNDLLELEQLLADFVAAILLFVESAGSLCELGAFTASDTILRRLIAVIEEGYREHTKSFVYLGPIRRLTKHDENRLVYAQWLSEDAKDNIDTLSAQLMCSRVEKAFSNALDQNSSSRLYGQSATSGQLGDGEAMCLITGLLDIFGTLTKTQIEDALRVFTEIQSQLQISRYLYLLRKLGHTYSIEYSKQIWYYTHAPLVNFSFRPNSKFRNVLAWKLHHRQLYKDAMENGKTLGKQYGALKQIIPLLPDYGESK